MPYPMNPPQGTPQYAQPQPQAAPLSTPVPIPQPGSAASGAVPTGYAAPTRQDISNFADQAFGGGGAGGPAYSGGMSFGDPTAGGPGVGSPQPPMPQQMQSQPQYAATPPVAPQAIAPQVQAPIVPGAPPQIAAPQFPQAPAIAAPMVPQSQPQQFPSGIPGVGTVPSNVPSMPGGTLSLTHPGIAPTQATDAGLIAAIKQQSDTFTKVLEQNQTALQQMAGTSTANDSAADYQAKVNEYNTQKKKLMDDASAQAAALQTEGKHAEANQLMMGIIDKIPPPPQPGANADAASQNVFMKSMQTDALQRGKERDPNLYARYNDEIKKELDGMAPDYRFSSAGVAKAEEAIRGRYYAQLLADSQQAYQHQYAQYQQQVQQSIPPQSLPRSDWGEHPGMNLHNLPAQARAVAHGLGMSLEEYAANYAAFNGGTRDHDSLAGAEGISLASEAHPATHPHLFRPQQPVQMTPYQGQYAPQQQSYPPPAQPGFAAPAPGYPSNFPPQ